MAKKSEKNRAKQCKMEIMYLEASKDTGTLQLMYPWTMMTRFHPAIGSEDRAYEESLGSLIEELGGQDRGH